MKHPSFSVHIALLLVFFGLTPVCAQVQPFAFDLMYEGNGILGLKMSSTMKALEGKEITMKGFMAPPLKARGNFFVLTRQAVSLCPFCNSDSDWPMDIVVVYLDASTTFIQANRQIEVRGILELGSYTDPETGFVSRVRIRSASWQ